MASITPVSFTVHPPPQRQSDLSAHSPLIIIKVLPLCTPTVTFWLLVSWDFQINFNQLWCAASVESLLLLFPWQAVRSSTESKHFHRCLHRLKITSKHNDWLTRPGSSQGFTPQASFLLVIRDVPTWAVYHQCHLRGLLSVCCSLDHVVDVTDLVKQRHCNPTCAYTEEMSRLFLTRRLQRGEMSQTCHKV